MLARIVGLAVLALALAVAARWLFTGAPGERAELDVDTRFDYVLTDFEADFYDSRGERSLVVAGPRLQHDPAEGIADIDRPDFRISPDDRNWRGRAEQAHIDRGGRVVHLVDNVRIDRELATGGRVTLTTERLRYDQPARTITTDASVEMTRPDGHLAAGGLRARIDTDRIELTDHVQGEFLPADPVDPADSTAD